MVLDSFHANAYIGARPGRREVGCIVGSQVASYGASDPIHRAPFVRRTAMPSRVFRGATRGIKKGGRKGRDMPALGERSGAPGRPCVGFSGHALAITVSCSAEESVKALPFGPDRATNSALSRAGRRSVARHGPVGPLAARHVPAPGGPCPRRSMAPM